MAARVMIAMPTTGTVKTATVGSLFEAVGALSAAGAQVTFRTKESADIARSRNHLASLALQEGATHLLFVDSDMTFSPDVIRRLFEADRPLVGAICPKRHIDLARLVDLARTSSPALPAQAVISRALDFVVRWPKGAASLEVQPDGLCRVRAVGMAMTLITADLLRAMIEAGAAVPRPVNFPGESLLSWGFFDQMEDENGNVLSEDMSFCARWTDQCGGAVWALATADVGHIGDLVHRGSVLAHYLPDDQLTGRDGPRI
jgi:hypothetical protein